MLLQPRWAPNCRPMFVPVVALLGVFGLWIARLHMGNLARILVAMLVSIRAVEAPKKKAGKKAPATGAYT